MQFRVSGTIDNVWGDTFRRIVAPIQHIGGALYTIDMTISVVTPPDVDEHTVAFRQIREAARQLGLTLVVVPRIVDHPFVPMYGRPEVCGHMSSIIASACRWPRERHG